MPERYKSSLRFADSDYEFWMWNNVGHYGSWQTMLCGECDDRAFVAMGGTIIKYDNGLNGDYALDNDAKFLCDLHFHKYLEAFSAKKIKDAITLALFDNGIDPNVIADVLAQLDLHDETLAIIPKSIVKEV